MSWSYIARYIVIPSNLIFNECGPRSAGPRGGGWDDDALAKRAKAAQKYIDTLNRKNGFYDKLEQSILNDGVRNPILVSAGWCPERKIPELPPKMKEDRFKILMCHSSGGSRLWVAQKHDMDIPCIITDFVGMFSEGKILKTEQDIFNCYTDKPTKVKMGGHGVSINNLPQTHMEENK